MSDEPITNDDVKQIISGLSIDALAEHNDAVRELRDKFAVLSDLAEDADLQIDAVDTDDDAKYQKAEVYNLSSDGGLESDESDDSDAPDYEPGRAYDLDPHGGVSEDDGRDHITDLTN